MNQIRFKIDKMDPFGRGICFDREQKRTLFVDKVLPGETGLGEIYREQKKLSWVRPLINTPLEQTSPLRTLPDCPHFQECNGCQYLHTSYQQELIFKRQILTEHFAKFYYRSFTQPIPFEIDVIPANIRLGYRNRIQLHYDLRIKKLGYIDPINNQIIEVPQCQLPRTEVANTLREFYHLKNWCSMLPPDSPFLGHVEIYDRDGKVTIAWNRPYADGGFTQVNEEMNLKLKQLIKKIIPHSIECLFDLFGGNGNLGQVLAAKKQMIIDQYGQAGPDFVKLDLNRMPIPQKLKNYTPQIFLIDPPRKGFTSILNWCESFKPQEIIYISCSPITMMRDLQQIKHLYEIRHSTLIDFFPSTYHFESLVHLSFKN